MNPEISKQRGTNTTEKWAGEWELMCGVQRRPSKSVGQSVRHTAEVHWEILSPPLRSIKEGASGGRLDLWDGGVGHSHITKEGRNGGRL